MKERILKYLKDEFGIETEEDFEKAVSEFHGIDISILIGGDNSAAETNQMEKCG